MQRQVKEAKNFQQQSDQERLKKHTPHGAFRLKGWNSKRGLNATNSRPAIEKQQENHKPSSEQIKYCTLWIHEKKETQETKEIPFIAKPKPM